VYNTYYYIATPKGQQAQSVCIVYTKFVFCINILFFEKFVVFCLLVSLA